MNVKIAKDYISDIGERPLDRYELQAKGFLECHERYKPLVSAIKDLIELCHDQSGDWPGIGKEALDHYRKEILGEK